MSKPGNIETVRVTLDHLHLEALAERGFVAASGGEFIVDVKLTAEGHATMQRAYALWGEHWRKNLPRAHHLLAWAERTFGPIALGMVSAPLSQAAQVLRREGEAQEAMEVTLRVLGGEDDYGPSERHVRDIELRFGPMRLRVRVEVRDERLVSLDVSRDGHHWVRYVPA